jgi:hypothetical protein
MPASPPDDQNPAPISPGPVRGVEPYTADIPSNLAGQLMEFTVQVRNSF